MERPALAREGKTVRRTAALADGLAGGGGFPA